MNLAGLSGQEGDVPPEVAWPPPDDGVGEYAGAWRLLELPGESDELEEFALGELGELDEFALGELDELDELDPFEVLEPEFCEPGDEELPVPVLAGEPPGVVTVVWVDPGSTAATTPAPTTLAKLTVAVAAVSRRRPRSRSATARDRSRAEPGRRPGWPYGDSPRGSELVIPPVSHTQMRGPYILPLRKLCLRARVPGFCLTRGAGIMDR
jgi:hypothetical protein